MPFIGSPNDAFQNCKSSVPDRPRVLHTPIGVPSMSLSHGVRQKMGIQGLLATSVQTPSVVVSRALSFLNSIEPPLQKFLFLQQLSLNNPDLFYMLVIGYTEQIMPIVYTPTVGLACQQWSNIYFSPQGLYIPITAAGDVKSFVDNWPSDEVDAIVFTDGGRILGLGDLGANGMGIPIGKLALYVACAGINPAKVLPVVLDLGTDNEELLKVDNYIGLRQPRSETSQSAFYTFVGEFMDAIVARYGKNTLLQFEDFRTDDAFRLLNKYRHSYMTFNDDIQGTAVMTLAGIMSALPLLKSSKIEDQRVMFYGAGSSGLGIAEMIAEAMAESGNVSLNQARQNIWAVDSRGLIVADRPKGGLTDHKMPFAHKHPPLDTLIEALCSIKPTILIGVSSQAKAFDSVVLKKMAELNDRPVIFALSNPTSKAECCASDAFEFTDGRVLFASGSPFPAVEYGSKTYHPRQANNVYVFPGIGLGALVASVSEITDPMLMAGSKALANVVTDSDRAQGSLYPHISLIRDISARIALAVAEQAFTSGFATVPKPEDLELAVKNAMAYNPAVGLSQSE